MKQILLAMAFLLGFTVTAQEHTMKVYKNGGVTHSILISDIDSVKIESNTNPENNTINGHEYVDLGLPSGLKWATCNVGATNPEDYGNYYAWGEITPKPTYTSYNSTTYSETMSDISGNATYDAARANWGSTWRMPTYKEMGELINNCIWTWTSIGGLNGYKITGSNGNSIFLPAARYRYGSELNYTGLYGSYWSSTPVSSLNGAYYLNFASGDYHRSSSYRYYGRSVRPVTE